MRLLPYFTMLRILVAGSVAVLVVHTLVATLGFVIAIVFGYPIHDAATAVAAFMSGAMAALALAWLIYAVSRFCMWLRRKQVEHDNHPD